MKIDRQANQQVTKNFKHLKKITEQNIPEGTVFPDWAYEEAIDWRLEKDAVTKEENLCLCVPIKYLLRKLPEDTGNKVSTSQIRKKDKTATQVARLEAEIRSLGQQDSFACKYYGNTEEKETHIKAGNGRFRALNNIKNSGEVIKILNASSEEGRRTIPVGYAWVYFIQENNERKIRLYQIGLDTRNKSSTNLSTGELKDILREDMRSGAITNDNGVWSDLGTQERQELLELYIEERIGGVFAGKGDLIAKSLVKEQKDIKNNFATWDKKTLLDYLKINVSDFSSTFESKSMLEGIEKVIEDTNADRQKKNDKRKREQEKAKNKKLKKYQELPMVKVIEPGSILSVNTKEGKKIRLGVWTNVKGVTEGASIQNALLSKIVNKKCDKTLLLLSFAAAGKENDLAKTRAAAIEKINNINKEVGKVVLDYVAFPKQNGTTVGSGSFFEEIHELTLDSANND